VVGGAPFRFDEALWRKVGADAMGRNGTDALRILEALEGRQP
jgi:methanogenic corrinoid protein MtbC1